VVTLVGKEWSCWLVKGGHALVGKGVENGSPCQSMVVALSFLQHMIQQEHEQGREVVIDRKTLAK